MEHKVGLTGEPIQEPLDCLKTNSTREVAVIYENLISLKHRLMNNLVDRALFYPSSSENAIEFLNSS